MKKIIESKKLKLNKLTLAHLQLEKMDQLKAGATAFTYANSCGMKESECCPTAKTSIETQNGSCAILGRLADPK